MENASTWQIRRFDYDVFRDEEVIRLLRDEDIRFSLQRNVSCTR